MTTRDRDLLLLAVLAYLLWPKKTASAAEVDQHGSIAVEVESLDPNPSGPPASAPPSTF